MDEKIYKQYKEDQDFNDYVGRYYRARGLGVFEALEHVIVKNTAQYYTEAKRDIIKDDKGSIKP